MRDTLYIQLRDAAPDTLLAYALAGSHPELGLRTEHATLENILGLAAGRRLVVFVPGTDVRLASVNVPARQAQKVLQATPYALEEQLAEDVDTLHFAIGNHQADDTHPVAIVSRERMDQWLAPLAVRKLKPEALYPEILCLPVIEPGLWTALIDQSPGNTPGSERVTVRSGAFSGFACPLEDLAGYLQLADPEDKVRLRIYLPNGVGHDFTRLNRPVELMPGHSGALEVLARHLNPGNSINLLQGAYSQKQDWRQLAQPWRMAGALAVAWAGLALAHEGIHAFRTGQELKLLQQHNVTRCQQIFPKECVKPELMSRVVEQQTRLLGSGPKREPLFQLLGTVAESLAANPGLDLKSLQFREGALYLSLTGSDLQNLEGLRAWYAARRETVLEVQSANAGADGVQIRLKLTLV